ncbi:MAG: PQQ-dependent sugar dehydrogenase [Opitutales bacterium]
MTITIRLLIGFAALSVPLFAQDPFPEPIALDSDLEMGLVPFARIPYSDNSPARMSVLIRDPMGRLFVNDQRGPLYLVSDDGATVSQYLTLEDEGLNAPFPELALDDSSGERGFHSFAFHPDFFDDAQPGFGRFYVYFDGQVTREPATGENFRRFDPAGQGSRSTLLVEFRTNDPAAVPFSPADPEAPYRILAMFRQPQGHHNGGHIAFNPCANPGDSDYGLLYCSLADGAVGGDPYELAEDPANPYGSLMRIDPLPQGNEPFRAAPDNLFASDKDPRTLDIVYAYGFRNPQRFSWDRATGNLFLGDIGETLAEEVNLLRLEAIGDGTGRNRSANGAHFGWDLREGSFEHEGERSPEMIDPVAEWDHENIVVGFPEAATGGRAATVGEVFRGPPGHPFNGLLPVGDFPSGTLFVLDVDNDPLDGGQNGLRELQPRDLDLERTRMFNEVRAQQEADEIRLTNRADIRFGLNTPGEIYIINKKDSIIRQLVVYPSLERSTAGESFRFFGVLVTSDQPTTGYSPVQLPADTLTFELQDVINPEVTFFRARRRTDD